jgi:error-prone DNA polymerase
MQARALEAILRAREEGGAFTGLADFCRRCCPPVPRDIVEALILVGAFDSLDPNRRRLLWELPLVLAGRAGSGLFGDGPSAATSGATSGRPGGGPERRQGDVPDFSPEEKMAHEYDLLGFSPGRHLLARLRPRLEEVGFVSSARLRRLPAGRAVKVGGLVIRPHRPPTRSGRTVVYLCLEDEEGLVDVTVFERTYQKYGRLIFSDPCPPLAVEGRVERRDGATAVIARRVGTLWEALR